MDHLPWRETHPRSDYVRPRVPLLGNDEADVCDAVDKFDNWPAYKGWDLSSPENGPLKTAQMLQAWLFFGVIRILTKSLGRPFDFDDWTAWGDDLRRYVDSTRLTELLQAVRSKCAHTIVERIGLRGLAQLTDFGTELFQAINNVLENSNLAEAFLGTVRGLERSLREQQWDWYWTLFDCFKVYWSLLLLWEHLCNWGLDIVGSDFAPKEAALIVSTLAALPTMPRGTEMFNVWMKMAGRCPTISNRRKWSPLKYYQLLSLPITTNVDHAGCEGRHCKMFDTTEADYVMKHVDSACSCQEVPIHTQTLHNIVINDHIPLVQSNIDGAGNLTVEIVDGGVSHDYVAISHVWAGGLGNPNNNAHYGCQLRQLHVDVLTSQKRSSRLPLNTCVHYWLDTLCVPIEQALKFAAMGSMAAIYAGARNVVVLDPELRQLDSRTLSARELDLTVVCSSWQSRSWTLQEGALAIDLSLKFRDGMVPYSKLEFKSSFMTNTAIRKLWQAYVDPLASPISHILAAAWSIVKSADEPSESGEAPVYGADAFLGGNKFEIRNKFSWAWNQLCDRSTKKPEDLAAIFAVFLDRSIPEILGFPAEQRMQALLGSQPELPIDLLFVPVEAHAKDWIPLFPTCKSDYNTLDLENPDDVYMDVNETGNLILSRLGKVKLLHLPQDVVASEHSTAFDITHNCCYHLRFELKASKQQVQTYSNVLLLLSSPDSSSNEEETGKGISFVVTKQDDTRLHAQYVHTLQWTAHVGECRGNPDEPASGESNTHTRFISPIDETYITPEHRLHLIMGTSGWPTLGWSRDGLYPFLDTNLRTAKQLSLFMALSEISICYLAFETFFNLMDLLPPWDRERSVWRHVLDITLFPGLLIIRRYLAKLEYRYLQGKNQQHLHENWALSFLPSIDAKELLRTRSMSTAARIGWIFLYSTLPPSSCAGAIFLIVRALRKAECPNSTGVNIPCLFGEIITTPSPKRTDPAAIFILTPICFIVSFELVNRVAMLAYFSSWRRTRERSLDKGYKALKEIDQRYNWVWSVAKFLLLAVITVLSIFGWALTMDLGMPIPLRIIFLLIALGSTASLPIFIWIFHIHDTALDHFLAKHLERALRVCGSPRQSLSKCFRWLKRKMTGRHDREIQLSDTEDVLNELDESEMQQLRDRRREERSRAQREQAEERRQLRKRLSRGLRRGYRHGRKAGNWAFEKILTPLFMWTVWWPLKWVIECAAWQPPSVRRTAETRSRE